MGGDWREDNRANWDERVDIHLAAPDFYDLAPLRAGRGRLNAIEEAELGPVAGLRGLHLQCHFGTDTLALAQRGADMVGLDFSPRAIDAATGLARELGLAARARFVCADLYDAPDAVRDTFDMVYVTWGAIYWLPDIAGWARIVAGFLRPGGFLYLAEGHPAALVFDDGAATAEGHPGLFVPYFQREALVLDDASDYADPRATLVHARQHSFMHTLGAIVTALIEAGLRLEFLHEHDSVTWRMFASLVEGADGAYRWPDRPWLPLSFSLRATRRA